VINLAAMPQNLQKMPTFIFVRADNSQEIAMRDLDEYTFTARLADGRQKEFAGKTLSEQAESFAQELREALALPDDVSVRFWEASPEDLDTHSCNQSAVFSDSGPQGPGYYCEDCGRLVSRASHHY
jgi:hypothetical protein